MTSGSFGGDLMAGPPPTLLPADPADAELAGGDSPAAVVRRRPDSPAAWAALAQQAQDAGADDVTVYAYSRVGYHRGLDSLRRNGWRGAGPIPWEHEPNQGFLRALYSLGRASAAIGEAEEPERIEKFLQESDPTAKAAIEARG